MYLVVLTGAAEGGGMGIRQAWNGWEKFGLLREICEKTIFFARLLFFTSSSMHMLGKLRPVILECFILFSCHD